MTARIVIIGGGQAGGWAAKTLRDDGLCIRRSTPSATGRTRSV